MSDIEKSPEFKRAVDEAVAKQTDAIAAKVLERIKDARGGADEPTDAAFARSLATSIAELSDQGVGRKRVAPELIRQRADARERMVQLLADARANKLIPTYKLVGKCYLNERLVEPIYIDANHKQQNTEIQWTGVPNRQMRPINDVAQAIYKAFSDSIGSVEKDKDDAPEEKPVLGITAGGRNTKSASRGMQPPSVLQHVTGPSDGFANQLSVSNDENKGQYRETHVLGTVAAPARQTA